jgi:hypothetical protein
MELVAVVSVNGHCGYGTGIVQKVQRPPFGAGTRGLTKSSRPREPSAFVMKCRETVKQR